MGELMTEEFILNFPAVLQSKIRAGEFSFPENTKFTYETISAYRCIFSQEEQRQITREDFRSYAELGKKPKRGQVFDVNKPDYYGVSLFTSKEELYVKMNLPRKGVLIALGNIYQEGGPQWTNGGHICWWLYENADVSSFQYVTEVKKSE